MGAGAAQVPQAGPAGASGANSGTQPGATSDPATQPGAGVGAGAGAGAGVGAQAMLDAGTSSAGPTASAGIGERNSQVHISVPTTKK